MSSAAGARSTREEAERLVAAALAALSMSARAAEGFATGSAECCVCPVCRAIAAARDPKPDFAVRLADGVGDLAEGVVSLLRAFSDARNTPENDGAATSERAAEPGEARDGDEAGDPRRAETRPVANEEG